MNPSPWTATSIPAQRELRLHASTIFWAQGMSRRGPHLALVALEPTARTRQTRAANHEKLLDRAIGKAQESESMTEQSRRPSGQHVTRRAALEPGNHAGRSVGMGGRGKRCQGTKPNRGAGTNPVSALTERLNPQMQHTREVALKILNPTPKELERGLRLHAESVVFDAYGFAPRAADRWGQTGRGHQCGSIGYRNQGSPRRNEHDPCATDPIEEAEFRDAWRASGVTCIFKTPGRKARIRCGS